MNEKGSVLIAEADLKVHTADQNIKFNGARTYRVEQKEIKDILQVDLKTGFLKGFLVSDYDQLESTLQVLVLPDSEFSFGFGAGGFESTDSRHRGGERKKEKILYGVLHSRPEYKI